MNIKDTFLKLTSKTYPHGTEAELFSFLPKKLCLHAYFLAFDHPETNKQVSIKLKPPKEFMEVLRGVGIDAKCLSY